MSKFNIGDKVRVVNSGVCIIINHIHDSSWDYMRYSSDDQPERLFYGHELEKVEDNTPLEKSNYCTLHELYLAAIKEIKVFTSVKEILKEYATGLYTDKWLTAEFDKIVHGYIVYYGNQFHDKEWITQRVNDGEFRDKLSAALKYYYMEVYEQ